MENKGFIKEIVVVVIAILILAWLGIDTQTAADYIKKSFHFIINLFN